MLMYMASRGAAPLYLSQLVPVADLPGRRCLRSVRTNFLLVPSVKLYCLRPGIPSRWTDCLEQSAGQRDFCSVSFYRPSASVNIFL